MSGKALLAFMLAGFAHAHAQGIERPFGTLREQAVEQQRWLDERMTTVLPA